MTVIPLRSILAFACAILAWPGVAAEVVGVMSEDVGRFSEMLGSPALARRIEGVKGLSHLKHWPAEDALLRVLGEAERGGDNAFELRRETVIALGRLGTAKSIPALIAVLDSGQWELRENARMALEKMTGHQCDPGSGREWSAWWKGSSLAEKQNELLAVAAMTRSNAPAVEPDMVLRRGKRVRPRSASASPAACVERRASLRALRHLAEPANEPALLSLLTKPQAPALDRDERIFLCEALERIGSSNAVPVLAHQGVDAAAWALARIRGADAEQALLRFPPTFAALLAIDHIRSTNTARFIPFLVQNVGQITYRGQPDDVMNDELQPIQRLCANLLRRSGLAPAFTELVLQELENSMQPPVAHGPRPPCPGDWEPLLARMRSELKPGFVREDGVTTTQPFVAVCYMVDDAKFSARLLPLLKHPSFVVRVYTALALGRLRASEAFGAITNIIDEGYQFSDSTALASGKHFDQSQTVRWKGFLCMALGRMGGEPARLALENYATSASRPRDVRYSSVVGLRFIASPRSVPAFRNVETNDVIWMVRDEARRARGDVELLAQEPALKEAKR